MRFSRSLLAVPAAMLALAGIGGCGTADMSGSVSGDDSEGVISGSVLYRERMALRPDAVVRVRLEDVSRADAPATILAEQTIPTEGRQVPIPYELRFDATSIDPRMRYAVRAEIRDADGALMFTTTTRHAVLASGGSTDQLDIMVQRVTAGGDAGAAPSLAGTAWTLDTYMAEGGTAERLDEPQSYTIDFGAAGAVSGQAHCNRFTGRYAETAAGDLTFEPLATTLRACLDPTHEREFLDAITRATRYSITGDRLRIEFGDGGVLSLVRAGATGATAAAPTPATFVFDCDGGIRFTVRSGPGEAALWTPPELGNRYFVLGQVRAASGARYEDGGTVFWDRGDEAMFEIDGQRYSGCRVNRAAASWEDARRRGVSLRALGNEPPWILEIGPDSRIVLARGYERQRTTLTIEDTTEAGVSTSYRASDAAGAVVTVAVLRRACADSMSGEAFDASVTVMVADETLVGCGRFL